MNFKMIVHTLGRILTFEAAFMLVPVITAVCYLEWSVLFSFLISMAIVLAVGIILSLISPKDKSLIAKDGFVIVAFSWIILSIFGALPFVLSGVSNNYIDALFETVSGFTTTGATIFADVEALPKAILMWRSFTHWVGGMGILVFVMAFIPLSGGRNMYIMKAESPGPSVSKLVPRVRSTAFLLYAIYFVMTILEFIFLLFGRMSPFEALNTAFSTAGTGGFGFKNDSLASYSIYVQVVVGVFMLLFSLNFGSYFFLIRGRFKDILTEEVKTFLIIVGTAVILITVNVMDMYSGFGEALLNSFFTVSSIMSTTGFSTADFDIWPEFSKTIIVIIMFIGACAGSTGGGMKVSRIMIIFKSIKKELNVAIHPNQIKKIRVDGEVQDSKTVKAVAGYLFAFIAIFTASLLIVSLDVGGFATNFTAVAATMGNIGPGLDKVGPIMNYAFFSPLSKLVLIFDMLAGRLEILPMLLLFMPSTWKK